MYLVTLCIDAIITSVWFAFQDYCSVFLVPLENGYIYCPYFKHFTTVSLSQVINRSFSTSQLLAIKYTICVIAISNIFILIGKPLVLLQVFFDQKHNNGITKVDKKAVCRNVFGSINRSSNFHVLWHIWKRSTAVQLFCQGFLQSAKHVIIKLSMRDEKWFQLQYLFQ